VSQKFFVYRKPPEGSAFPQLSAREIGTVIASTITNAQNKANHLYPGGVFVSASRLGED